MNHCKLRCKTSLMLLALSISCVTGAQVTDQSRREIVPGVDVRDTPVSTRLCARPFARRGAVELDTGYSGSVGEFTTPNDAILEIRRVRTTLRVAGLSASAIGTWSDDLFAWHPMRVEAGVGRFAAAQDGLVHADRASLVKIGINRSGSTSVAVTGDYELNGCLVDRIPDRLRIPDTQLPRLPPKILHPRVPVEKLKPVREMPVKPYR